MKFGHVRIKRRYVYLGAALLLLLGSGLYIYWRFEPSAHFKRTDIPILATPEADLPSTGPQSGATEPGPPQTPAKANDSSRQNSFNILILGTDARSQELSRTDVIMLAHVNPDRHTVNLISIPRDTRVHINGVGYTKINHAHVLGEMNGGDTHSGTQATIQAVSNLFSSSINYYIKTDFEGFEHFIDTLGGLDVYLEQPVKLTYGHKTFPAGDNHLSGAEALDLVRERKSLPGGDTSRQANQAMVLKEIVRTVIKPQNIKRLPSLISQVREDILDTNLSDNDMISLAWMVQEVKEDGFQYVQLPGYNGRAMDPLVKSELYYWMPDMDEWATSSQHLLED